MWELDCEESWALKNWCFWTVVLEKTLESPLDCKEIQLVNSEGDWSWNFFGRNDAKAETPVLEPTHAKGWLTGKDSDAGRDRGQEEKGMTKDEMAWWHHQLDGCEFEWTLGVGDGQGGLACCNSQGRKESDTTEWMNWTEAETVSGYTCVTLGENAVTRTPADGGSLKQQLWSGNVKSGSDCSVRGPNAQVVTQKRLNFIQNETKICL